MAQSVVLINNKDLIPPNMCLTDYIYKHAKHRFGEIKSLLLIKTTN